MPQGPTKLRDAVVETRRVAPRLRPPAKAPSQVRLMVRVGAPVGRLVRAYPGRSAAAVLVGVLMAGIVGNAMLFQRGRHPAPLFAGFPAPAATPPRPLRPAASPPVDTSALDSGSQTRIRTDPLSVVPPSRPPLEPAEDPSRRKDKMVSSAVGDDLPTGVAAPKSPDPHVLQAQHALVKLGFDIKPDGHLGVATRKALDKFASAHHLDTMTGTLSPKLLQTLTAAASKPQG